MNDVPGAASWSGTAPAATTPAGQTGSGDLLTAPVGVVCYITVRDCTTQA
jgi:hypothetical protein